MSIKELLNNLFIVVMLVFISGLAFAKDITITSPANNAIVYQGDTITINVQVSNLVKLTSLFLVTPGNIKEFPQPPYSYTITIPDKLGNFGIMAMGKTAAGDIIDDNISLIVKTHALLESIDVEPEKEIYLQYPEDPLMISVLGKYSNGKIEYLNSAVGLRFISNNTSVAIVDNDGLVTAKGDGQCTITINFKGKTQKVVVKVAVPADVIKAKINLQPKILDEKVRNIYIVI